MDERSKFPDELLKEKFETLHGKIDDTEEVLVGKLDAIDDKVTYTNGKVRKIIIALIGVGFFSLGLGFEQIAPLLKILLTL